MYFAIVARQEFRRMWCQSLFFYACSEIRVQDRWSEPPVLNAFSVPFWSRGQIFLACEKEHGS
jgi:hypothetical protein